MTRLVTKCDSRHMIEVGDESYSVYEPVRCELRDGHPGRHQFTVSWDRTDDDA